MVAALCVVSLAALLFVGCNPQTDPQKDPDVSKDIPVSEVTLNQASLILKVGQTANLTAKVSPKDATDKTVTWSSSDPSVATVDNGKVTAVAEGSATITAAAGGKSATCSLTVRANLEESIKTALMKLYNALDGPNWNITNKWDMAKSLSEWDCIEWDEETDEIRFVFYPGNFGLKGELPDCFDELPTLTKVFFQNEPGLTGTLPPSFATLRNLKEITLCFTSMTGLPDIFEGMPLETVYISGNDLMTGPLPASIGSSPELTQFLFALNAFTGTVPDSWAHLGSLGPGSLGSKFFILEEAHLDAQVPNSFVTSADAGYLVNMYLCRATNRTTPFVVGDYDIPAFWPVGGLKDLVTGQEIPFKEICARNKATILLNWGTWCPYSKVLMPVLKQMYEKYHKDGLEIIAAFNADDREADSGKTLKEVILELGYDQWYNFNIWDFTGPEWTIWCGGATPSAVIVDKDGNIVTSSLCNVSDPIRNRYNYTAATKLIPVLENMFGPLDDDDDYVSTDYSQDGKVFTIQKATAGNGINLVIMGDAYTDKDIESGLYEQVMRGAAEQFFSIEPYKSFKNRFNVYAVKVVSKNGKTGPGFSTALNTEMYAGAAVTGTADVVYNYALKVPEISSKNNLTVAVLVNSIYTGGVADMSESLQSGIGYCSSMGNDPSLFRQILLHETGGHGFAFLADEYVTTHGTPSQAAIDARNNDYNSYGWYSNIDFTDDPTKIRWAAFLSDPRYKDEVGIFEGGMRFSNGVYRPSGNSMMNQNIDFFNAPSRLAIYKRIMELSGEGYSFEKFLQYDAVNRGTMPSSSAIHSGTFSDFPFDTPPVVTP